MCIICSYACMSTTTLYCEVVEFPTASPTPITTKEWQCEPQCSPDGYEVANLTTPIAISIVKEMCMLHSMSLEEEPREQKEPVKTKVPEKKRN